MSNPRYYQIEGESSLVRDMKSKAILNTNVELYNAYKKQRNFTNRLKNMVNEFDDVKAEISEIKNLLKIIINQGEKNV
jgi:hypothetical protein